MPRSWAGERIGGTGWAGWTGGQMEPVVKWAGSQMEQWSNGLVVKRSGGQMEPAVKWAGGQIERRSSGLMVKRAGV